MNNKRKKAAASVANKQSFLCDELSFAGTEAYKLLRTNIMFSFPDSKKCKVIGVTSSVAGEGKSTTSINLAYSLAQMGKRVLLMEADMRLPNIAKRFQMRGEPGLSDLLVGRANGEQVLQRVERPNKFFLIPGGVVPPNPVELLSSARMESCIHATMQSFDYVVVDLPPTNMFSDALTLSKLVDGYVFVVRQGYATRQMVSETMNKIRMVEGKVLGFVLNDAESEKKTYGGYHNYGYQYSKYRVKADAQSAESAHD